MTKDQYMRAARMRVPVIHNGVRYVRIGEIRLCITGEEERRAINRNVPDEFIILHLLDASGHSSTNAPPEQVEVDPEVMKMYPEVFGDGAVSAVRT